MKPRFSEFSYGYAVTEELVKSGNVAGPPEFPTLYAEGQSGGGYDVKIPFGIPVFLQFKLSDYLSRRSAKEFDKFKNPYYRMHLHRIDHSNQHRLLLEWENKGEAVFYIAPEFHEPSVFSDHYLKNTIVEHSAVFKPSAIGSITDTENHYVVFESGTPHGYFCSEEPKKIEKSFLTDELKNILKQENRMPQKIDREYLIETGNNMLNILQYHKEFIKSSDVNLTQNKIKFVDYLYHTEEKIFTKLLNKRTVDSFRERMSPSVLKYISRTFFGLELLIIKQSQK